LALRGVAFDWAVALAAGYVATKVTDRAQRALWRATPKSEKAREPEAPQGSSAKSAAQLLCEWCGITPTEPRLRLLKQSIHYGLGIGWGSIYGFLRRQSKMTPIGAGVVTGTSLSLIIDEALNPALGITPPAREYPTSSHIRGLFTHLVYGLALAAVAEGLYRLAQQPRAVRPPEPRPALRLIRTRRSKN
jgi:hypothetical protein